MVEKFVGTWKMISSENFDDYMKAIGRSPESDSVFFHCSFTAELNFRITVYFRILGFIF